MNNWIPNTLNGTRKELLFLELHGDIPPLSKMHELLQQWRHAANQHKVPFFAFMLLREPVSFHVSYFAQFHKPSCKQHWCEPKTYPQTQKDFLKHGIYPNHQCEILAHGQHDAKPSWSQRPFVTVEECRNVDYYLEND